MRKASERELTVSERWLRWLHVLFTAIFGLVLPFICWGAEATPSHVHARAHFVFLPPPAHSANFIGQELGNAHDLLHATATALANGLGELCAAPLPGALSGSATPVTQSTPLVLAVTILLLMALNVQLSPERRDGGGFRQRLATLRAYAPPLVIATPPPR